MENFIKIKNIEKRKNKVNIFFEVSEKIKKYFNNNNYFVEYNFDIMDIPESILNISFICNILPILWIENASLVLNTIDEEFYYSIEKFKEGYIKMYPQINFFDTKIIFNKIEKNSIEKEKVGTFFSGGVDAFATLFAHMDEKPLIITVWGADITTDDTIGWEKMKDNVLETSKLFGLEYQFIKSNFKEFLNTKELNNLVVNSGDKWWHGFQHGIGLISLSATIAYHFRLEKVYIASSYTEKDIVTCASHPTIDNFIKFCNTDIIHDQYKLNRQSKIEKIVNYTEKVNKYPYIHVCWESKGGENCCKCEKCCRTIIGIYASNGNPIKYGFKKTDMNEIKKYMYFYNNIDRILIPIWNDIKYYYIKNKEHNLYQKEIGWIENFNPQNNRTVLKKIFRKGKKIIERAKKI